MGRNQLISECCTQHAGSVSSAKLLILARSCFAGRRPETCLALSQPVSLPFGRSVTKIETFSVLPVPVWQLAVPSCRQQAVRPGSCELVADLQAHLDCEVRADIKQGDKGRTRRAALQGKGVILDR